MGFVADMPNCNIAFGEDAENPIAHGSLGYFDGALASWGAHFRFQCDPKTAPPPDVYESWRVGLVQNVLYDYMRFEYVDGLTKTMEFQKPAVDSNSQRAFPFYGMLTEEAPVTPGDASKLSVIERVMLALPQPRMEPYLSVVVSNKGFGERFTGTRPDGFPVDLMAVGKVSLMDQPPVVGKWEYGFRNFLKRCVSITAFQIWLVAIEDSGKQPFQVLAHTDPFSMLYIVEPPPVSSSVASPRMKPVFRRVTGIGRSERDFRSASKFIRVGAGPGQTPPLLKGDTALTRMTSWYEQNMPGIY